ncbi:hypothetical protein [Cryobacterium aureum]|uniref:hypothetical protein n=1 Tax=Cryobacterium aureum TaxID=995037 RepID=UPI00101AE19F|nr:hypothetical protein [Cryobacterium aureum]
MDDSQRAELEAQVADRKSQVQEAWARFIAEEPQFVRTELESQARLTAIEQSAVTSTVPGGVPSLRAEMAAVISKIVESTDDYFRAVSDEDITNGWNRRGVGKGFNQLVQPFGDLLIGLGFDSGSKPAHPGLGGDWYFYGESNFHTSLQRRGGGLPMAESFAPYEQAVERLRQGEDVLEKHNATVERANVAASWDAGE